MPYWRYHPNHQDHSKPIILVITNSSLPCTTLLRIPPLNLWYFFQKTSIITAIRHVSIQPCSLFLLFVHVIGMQWIVSRENWWWVLLATPYVLLITVSILCGMVQDQFGMMGSAHITYRKNILSCLVLKPCTILSCCRSRQISVSSSMVQLLEVASTCLDISLLEVLDNLLGHWILYLSFSVHILHCFVARRECAVNWCFCLKLAVGYPLSLEWVEVISWVQIFTWHLKLVYIVEMGEL